MNQAERSRRWLRIALLTTLVFGHLPDSASTAQTAHATDRGGLDLICPLVEHERRRDLEDYELEVKLVESEYQSRREVFGMVEKLWAVRSIEREIYLDYRRLRDRTQVRVGRMKAQIAQQKSVVEQYELTCGEDREEKTVGEVKERIAALHAQYRRIDCELLDRDVEIAAIDYDYDASILSATRTLVESNIKTKFELVIEEYDLSQSKERVDGYRSRAKACRKRLKDRPKH
jgi:hypothetical protein